MQLKEGLKEIAFGQWEGKMPEEVNREFHDDYVRWLTDPGWNSPTGGERGIDIARRSLYARQSATAATGRKMVTQAGRTSLSDGKLARGQGLDSCSG